MTNGGGNQNSETAPVVDFHVHVLSSREDWTDEAHRLIRKYNPTFYENLEENLTPVGVLRGMDEAGVDYAVVLPEYAPLTHGTITNEFVVELPGNAEDIVSKASQMGVLAGVPLSRLVDGFDNCILVSVTDKTTEEWMDTLVSVLKEVCG